MVVDDDRQICRMLRACLESAGYEVVEAFDGDSALRLLAKVQLDMVVTDIIMPKLNGVDAIKLIAHEFPAVRIIAISGGGNFDVIGNNSLAMTTTSHLAAAKHAGAHYILKKPFEAAELIQAVQKAIEDGSP